MTTAFVYDAEEARSFIKSRVQAKAICAINPSARNALRGKGYAKILEPLDLLSGRDKEEVIECIAVDVKLLENALIRNGDYSRDVIESAVNLAWPFLAKCHFVESIAKSTTDWIVWNKTKWSRTSDLSVVCHSILEKDAFFSLAFEHRHKSGIKKSLAKLANWLTCRQLTAKKTIVVSGARPKELFSFTQDWLEADSDRRIVQTGEIGYRKVAQAFGVALAGLFGGSKRLTVFVVPKSEKGRCRGFRDERGEEFSSEVVEKLNIKFAPLVNRLIQNTVTWFDVRRPSATRLLTKIDPSAVVTDQLKWFEPVLLGDLARYMSCEVVLISHGMHAGWPDGKVRLVMEAHDRGLLLSRFASKIVAQSPPAKRILQREQPGTKVVSGLAPFRISGTTFKKNRGLKRTVIHIGTPKALDAWPVIYEQTTEYIRAIEILANGISAIPDVQFIVRARSTNECDQETFQELLRKWPCMRLSADESLESLLADATLVISYNSTAIEEALSCRVPVGIFGVDQGFLPFGSTCFADTPTRSALYVIRPEKVTSDVSKIITRHAERRLTDAELEEYVWVSSKVGKLTLASLMQS